MLFLLIVREKRLWAELAFDLLNAVVFSSDMVQVVHPQLKSYVRALSCISALVTVKFMTAMVFDMCFEVVLMCCFEATADTEESSIVTC